MKIKDGFTLAIVCQVFHYGGELTDSRVHVLMQFIIKPRHAVTNDSAPSRTCTRTAFHLNFMNPI